MAQLIVVYWRDIPSQVIGRAGRNTHKKQLSHRFQEAIDRAAMRAGKGSSDAYLSEWRRENRPCPASGLKEEVERVSAEFETGFSDEDLTRLIRSKGVDESTSEAEPDPRAG